MADPWIERQWIRQYRLLLACYQSEPTDHRYTQLRMLRDKVQIYCKREGRIFPESDFEDPGQRELRELMKAAYRGWKRDSRFTA